LVASDEEDIISVLHEQHQLGIIKRLNGIVVNRRYSVAVIVSSPLYWVARRL